MSCEECSELCQRIEIQTPSDFEMVLRVVKTNVADGTIQQAPAAPGRIMPPVDVASLPERGPWPDIVEESFHCLRCDQEFALEAETFHGAGGKWSPR